MSKKKKKLVVKNEFRFNNNTKHMNYVFGASKNRYYSVGLTTEPETFNKKNMPLKDNPHKGKTDNSYIRNGIISDRKEAFDKKPNKNWIFSTDDFPKVKSKVRNYKKKRRK